MKNESSFPYQLSLLETFHTTLCELAALSSTLEICGLIGGKWAGNIAYAQHLVPIHNVSPTPHHHFLMHPAEQIRAMSSFENAGLETIAIYHSHPTGQAFPSPLDLQEYQYPNALMMIIYPLLTKSSSRYQIAVWHIQIPLYYSVPYDLRVS